MVRRHTYESMEDAPKDGRAIIGVCGGVEACICFVAVTGMKVCYQT